MSNDFAFGFDLSISSYPFGLTSGRSGLHGPFAPTPLQGLRRYYGPSRPCSSRYSALAVSAAWGSPSRDQGRTSPISTGRRYRGDKFSCSMPAPGTSSRHLYTGHRQGHTQAAPRLRAHLSARLYPEDEIQSSVSMPSELLSMRQQWFTHVRLLVPHLTRSRRAFSRDAHHDGSLPPQLPVVWAPRLHGEPGGPNLHHWHSTVRADDLLHRQHFPFRTHDLRK